MTSFPLPKIITSLQNPRVKSALRLHSSRGRKTQQRMIIFGKREIQRAVDSGIEIDLMFVDESVSGLDSILLSIDPSKCWLASDAVMEKLQYGNRGDGVVATALRPSTELVGFHQRLRTDQPMILVVLEAVEKPGNLGAILRSVDAAGASGLLLADPITDVFHPNSIRASTGTVFSIPIAIGSNVEIQKWLAEHQVDVLTAFLESSEPFYEQTLDRPTAIVLGNEANGLSGQWRQPEYQAVRVPMQGVADSLNVAVTASLMLFEARRQRDQRDQR